MKHTKHCILFMFFLLYTCNVYGQYFRQLGLNDGLSNLSVLSICQDKLGRMWFGTNQGINIYDGVTVHNSSYFKNVYKNWDLLEGRISDIVSDKKGNIFFRNSGNLVKYSVEKDEFTHIKLSHNVRVSCVLEGNFHFMVSDSLFMYDADKDSICLKEVLPFSYLLSLAKKDDKLYLGTKSGLYVKERNQTKKLLADVYVTSLLMSSWGELWIGTEQDGLYRLDKNGVLKKEILSDRRVINKQIRQIIEDDQHNIWFGTFKGLQVYHPKTDTYEAYTPQPFPGSLSHNSVFSLYIDQTKGLWVGTYYGGVSYLGPYSNAYSFYPYSDYANQHGFNHKIVGSIVESNDHCLWVATEGGGVNGYNRTTQQYTYITAEQKNSILANNIKSLAYDKERNCLYIGTHMGGLSKYDIKQKKVYNYLTDTRHKKGPNEIIYKCIFENNFLYVTAGNGFWKLDPRTDEFEFIGKGSIYQEFEIVDGYAWIAIAYSMYRINLSDYSEVIPVLREKKLKYKGRINKIRKSHDGLIYVVTDGNGVYVYDKNMQLVHNYTEENNGLLSNYCFDLVETSKHRILIVGNNGLSLLAPESKQSYNVEFQEIEKNGFTLSIEGDLFIASDSTVFLSGIHGMVSFKEDDLFLQKKEIDSRLHFSKILINNHLVQPTDGTDILSKALPFTSTVDLAYNQNNVTVVFSNPSYSKLNSSFNYSYKLEGFDSEWITTEQNRITYTDLDPGKYTLKLRTQNLQDESQGKEIGLNIVIHRPWFLSWGAMVVYVLVLSYIVYRFWKITLSRKILALSLQKEKEEKERIEDLNKMKLNFFTNISHDFRTPLTLIIGQIEMLLQHENVPTYFNRKLWNIHKNASHMRLLITELLDFRKQEQGFLKLKVECTNAIDLVKSVYISFAELAQKRAIRYTFVSVEDAIDLWVDPVQMQKVVYNLISNAFKYTQNGHEITVTVNKNVQNIEISVEDTGCGIPQNVLPLIFDHFYQVEGNSKKQILGTGIGLALVKGIVDSHHGTIKVESTEGVGSVFTITLLKGNSHFTSEELVGHELPLYSSDVEELSGAFQAEWMDYPSEQTNEKVQADGEDSQEENEDNDLENNDLPKVLLVEDDIDMLKMLEEIFSPSYLVYTATDGQMGFDKALEVHPDLVVSDVMMPVMSGKDMCYRIKNSLSLAFVPVVLLTAQSSDENIIKGYMFGADDYITKPFNVKLLLIKCNNLVMNRQELLKAIRENKDLSLNKSAPSDSTLLTTANQELVEKTIKIIKDNFSNSSFNMNTLAYELNIGRSRMYTCIKESIGITPNELVLKLKFEEALRMLKEEPNYNISEISFQLGFSSPQYFTRSFKAFYGETPQAYRKKLNV